MAKKEKKISVKHYLNKKLKPLIDEDENELLYPVYMRIRYSGAMTEIKSQYYLYRQPDESSSDYYEYEILFPFLSEKTFELKENQEVFSSESNAIELVIKELTKRIENPVSDFLPTFFTLISIDMKGVLEQVIEVEIFDYLESNHPILYSTIQNTNFNLDDFLTLIREYFEIKDYKILFKENEHIINLIDIFIDIKSNKEFSNTKLYLPIINHENIFQLTELRFQILKELIKDLINSHMK